MPTDQELGQMLYNYGRPGGTARYSSSFSTPFPPTAKAPPYPSTSLEPAIQGLITPGLVPDIARMSAETTAGRGIAGSPAADSTAVKMSEQNYLQRLTLANQLLTGEAGRTLPYQITPYQSAGLTLGLEELDRRYPRGGQSFGGGGGGGGGPAPQSTPWAGFAGQHPAIPAVGGTRPDVGISNPFMPQAGGYGGGGMSPANTLDDVYEWLGFGDFGSLPGDSTPDSPDMGYLGLYE